MQANPLVVPLLLALFAAIGYMVASMVEFDIIVNHLQRVHPDEWDASGRPAAYFVVVPDQPFFTSLFARGRLVKLLLKESPDWVSDDDATSASVVRWRRRYRRGQIAVFAYAVLFVASLFLPLVEVA